MIVVTFKRAKISGIESIFALARKTVDRSYRDFLDDFSVDMYLRNKHLDVFLEKNIKNTWVLSKDNAILGFSICIDNVIDFMMIDVDHHRQGYGTILLQHCEDLLFENHKVIALESFEENINASNFYLANNWVITEKYRDPRHNAMKIIFRKQLYTAVEQQRKYALGRY